MYRCNVNKALSYTPEDFLLFKESPFASWMERLTVDNPDHGIEPDWGPISVVADKESVSGFDNNLSNVESITWNDFIGRQSPLHPLDRLERFDSATAQQSDTGDVVIFSPCSGERMDGSETLAAMHAGALFVVNARLVQGPLSCNVDMLMRSPGVSSLGDYLYLPCATTKGTSEESALRLSFAADLLEDIQGKLPPQMLVIQPTSQMDVLNTQNHLLHFRVMKKRFLEAQGTFKKHRIPNPGDSSHSGRWSQFADVILKRRALGKYIPDNLSTKAQVCVDRDWPDNIVKIRAVG
jgi:hypothetical protein